MVLCDVLTIFIYLFICRVLVQLQRLRSDWGRWDNEVKPNTQTHRNTVSGWTVLSDGGDTTAPSKLSLYIMYSWTERQIMAYNCTRKQGNYTQINKESEFMLYSWIKTTGLANHVWSSPSSGAVSMPWISKRRNLWWTLSAHHGQHTHSDRKGRLCHLSQCLRLWGLHYARVINKCSFRASLNQGFQCSLQSCEFIHTMHVCAAKRTTFRSLFSFHMMVS